jgi:ribonuclease P protein component
MLPREHRLVGEKNFERLKKIGRLYKGKFLGLVVYKRGDFRETKTGFTVSLKVSKKATIRNKIKRQLRDIVFSLIKKIDKGWDLLFLIKRNCLTCSKEDLKKDILDLLAQAEIIKK